VQAYFSPNIITVIKWKMMIWMGHVARMGEIRNRIQNFDWKAKGRYNFGDCA
jgi:hypothetical protein